MKRLLLLISIPAFLCGCSSSESSDTNDSETPNDAPANEPTEIVVAARDSSVFFMGRRHAARMLDNHSHHDSICNELLELRARENDIRTRIDDDAANAYVAGIRAQIIESNTALADSLFGSNR